MHLETVVTQETRHVFQHHPTKLYQKKIYAYLAIAPQIQSGLTPIHPTHYEFAGISEAQQDKCKQNPCIYHSLCCLLNELKDVSQENQPTKVGSPKPNAYLRPVSRALF